jgi:hypothetical protein
VLLLALITQITFAQERQFRGGTVSDNSGQPLRIVSVILKVPKQTDLDGKYSIKAS